MWGRIQASQGYASVLPKQQHGNTAERFPSPYAVRLTPYDFI
jgi:hypothetical protein